jgi:cation diffusion facilitator CzcD-associated flavoprotein CzcO
MARSVSVAIVGAGFGGVAAAVALKRQGVEDLVLLERGEQVGGVWWANTYPGLACDVPSHLYSFSFAPNEGWTRRYSPGAEIQGYLEDVARRFDVLRHARFGCNVERASFDDDTGRWRLDVAGGDAVEADVVVTACGQLARPAIPDVPGLERFQGPMFHSAHWDHGQDLTGRRVAVLGTGASAIQFVPAIAPDVAQLTIFQRSAPWIVPKLDRLYPARTKRLHAQRPTVQRAWREGWRMWMESLVPLFTRRPQSAARAMVAPFRALAHAVRAVQLRGNRRLMAATRPGYEMGCKRVLITSGWYPTLRRTNVKLVTEPIRAVEADAVTTADGTRHGADAIIFGTGFTATEFLAPMEVHGREDRRLADAWEHGAEAYLGITVPSFPNLFLLYGPNTNHGTGSAIEMLEMQAGYAADAVRLLSTGAANRLEVRRDVHEAFQRQLQGRLADSVWARCESWYVTSEGRITNNWPGSQREYRQLTRELALSDYLTDAPRPVPSAA